MLSFDSQPWLARSRQRCIAACLLVAGASMACAPITPIKHPEAKVAEMPPAPAIVYVPTVEPVDTAARHLLAYQETLSRLPTADLSRELGRLGDGASSLQATMDLALVLGLTRTSGDLAKAQILLDQVLGNPSPEAQAWHGLARLLAARYADQRRAEDQVERLNQQLRDVQKDNQRKLDQLNEKLEALKSIERSLNSRNTPGPGPAAPQASSAAKPVQKP
ncbi:hypothetical protein [Aquabacterium sp.]|uniref:hypothetical protein n=1 Tax=Aquabacterium sp. TaxID=1872578 RepID=UPI0019B563A2|nr:hypothetical protein [Aquabacterium sp.]MBC7699445.1 hypothetical protein [Aquabacterium sp.]